ncbi:uncharacterized protein [Palaemon carinicauda]|uniref:uncharacterized protein n=1 Tax=Palaemon carinicauda TaxID=392227 RepID=UPI0035B657AB
MCFTRKRVNCIPEIRLENSVIPFVTKHRFLGMVLDGPQLIWKYHVEYLRLNCLKRLDVMRRIAHTSWGGNHQSLFIFYKSFLRSKMDYGDIVYGSASKTLLSRLDVIQSTALRLISGAFRSSPILLLHCEVNCLPLSYWRQFRLMVWYTKICNSSLDHPLFQCLSHDYAAIHSKNWTAGRQVPTVVRASYALSSLHFPCGSFSPLPDISPLPPWFPMSEYLSSDFPVAAKQEGHLVVSLDLIRCYAVGFRSLVDPICCSLKSLVDPICCSLKSLKEKNIVVKLQWVPSHSGVPGNKLVDSIAKGAHSFVNIVNPVHIPVSEHITAYRRAVWEKWRLDREVELQFSQLGPYRRSNLLTALTTSLASRKLNSAILQLHVGHLRLKDHLHRLSLEDSPFCSCGEIEDVRHIILQCPRYFTSSVFLRHSLFRIGVPFQIDRILGADSETPHVLKKIYRHLAVFLKSSGLLTTL